MAFTGVGLSWATEPRIDISKIFGQHVHLAKAGGDSLKLMQVTLPGSSKLRDQVKALLKAYE